MVFISLLPIGLVQFFAVIEHGYWFARSPAVIHSELVETLVWMRMPGDVLFSFGGIFIAIFFIKLVIGAIRKSKARLA